MRLRLSYANVVATLSPFFAMTGGAIAARRCLVDSTKQINPRVHKALKGAPGERGPISPRGNDGARGETGPSGQPSNLMWAKISSEGKLLAGHGPR